MKYLLKIFKILVLKICFYVEFMIILSSTKEEKWVEYIP